MICYFKHQLLVAQLIFIVKKGRFIHIIFIFRSSSESSPREPSRDATRLHKHLPRQNTRGLLFRHNAGDRPQLSRFPAAQPVPRIAPPAPQRRGLRPVISTNSFSFEQLPLSALILPNSYRESRTLLFE